MRTFNRKIALRVFLVLLVCDGTLLAVGHPENTLITVLWWAFNFPGFPLVFVAARLVPVSETGIVIMVGLAGLFSMCFWSICAGYVFRRSYGPNETA